MTLEEIVSNSNMELSAIHNAFELGIIDLKGLVEAEDAIGKRYSKWAEVQDSYGNKRFYKNETPYSGLGSDLKQHFDNQTSSFWINEEQPQDKISRFGNDKKLS